MKKDVLMVGGNGFVEKRLTAMLIENNLSVSILSRSQKQNSADISYYKWAAGTGCDAAPYFRVFNPEIQLKKFDEKGI